LAIPGAEVGLVFRYNYLWRHEANRGRTLSKERPACLIATLARGSAGTIVVILPITHVQPPPEASALEIPAAVKSHLGLDEQRSWIVTSECNVDSWPNPDLVPVARRSGGYAYGFLPPRLFNRVRNLFIRAARAGRVSTVRRTE
jgi:hypothetical protein